MVLQFPGPDNPEEQKRVYDLFWQLCAEKCAQPNLDRLSIVSAITYGSWDIGKVLAQSSYSRELDSNAWTWLIEGLFHAMV
jgi:hypothetical protein